VTKRSRYVADGRLACALGVGQALHTDQTRRVTNRRDDGARILRRARPQALVRQRVASARVVALRVRGADTLPRRRVAVRTGATVEITVAIDALGGHWIAIGCVGAALAIRSATVSCVFFGPGVIACGRQVNAGVVVSGPRRKLWRWEGRQRRRSVRGGRRRRLFRRGSCVGSRLRHLDGGGRRRCGVGRIASEAYCLARAAKREQRRRQCECRTRWSLPCPQESFRGCQRSRGRFPELQRS
jgi:hypothetical protein